MALWVDILSAILIISGALAMIFCGHFIAKPNFWEGKFKEKNCTITKSIAPKQSESLRSCKKSKYPCIIVEGKYWAEENKEEKTTGYFYNNQDSLHDKCLIKPKCSEDDAQNAASVYNYFHSVVVPKVDDGRFPNWSNISEINYVTAQEFTCFANGTNIMFENNADMVAAYLAVFIPLAAFIFGLIIGCGCGSPKYKGIMMNVAICPFFSIYICTVKLFESLLLRRNNCDCEFPNYIPQDNKDKGKDNAEAENLSEV